MGVVIGALTALGVGLTGGAAGGGAAAIVGGIAAAGTAGSLASTGLAIHGSLNKPELPEIPSPITDDAGKRAGAATRRFAAARTRNVVSRRATLGGTTPLAAPTALGPGDIPSIP